MQVGAGREPGCDAGAVPQGGQRSGAAVRAGCCSAVVPGVLHGKRQRIRIISRRPGPGQAQFAEGGVRRRRAFQGIFDTGDHGVGRVAVAHPLQVLPGDESRSFGGADGFQHPHERAAVRERADQRRASVLVVAAVPQMVQQVPGEVVPAKHLVAFAGCGADAEAVFGVVEHRGSFAALQGDVRFHGLRGAQGQRTGHGKAGGGADTDDGGVV
ncbi:hypothetical protein D9M72_406160 [compost metagenome]